LLVTDHLAHAWDIGHALNLGVPLDAELIPGSFAWARDHIIRVPGLFGPEVTPPPDADEQTRWLAFLGRAAWPPSPADDDAIADQSEKRTAHEPLIAS